MIFFFGNFFSSRFLFFFDYFLFFMLNFGRKLTLSGGAW